MQQISQEHQDEISLLDLMLVISKRWKMIVVLALVTAFTASLIVILVPRTFQSTAKIVAFSQEEILPIGVVRSERGGKLAGFDGVTLKQQNMPIIIDLLQSEPLLNVLAKQFGLSSTKVVSGLMKAKASKSGVVEITVEHSDSRVAANIANAAVKELGNQAYNINLIRSPIITAEHDLDTLRSDDNVVLKLLQQATPAAKPIKPKRTMIVVLSFVSALFAGVLLAFALEAVQKLSPDDKRRWEQIKKFGR